MIFRCVGKISVDQKALHKVPVNHLYFFIFPDPESNKKILFLLFRQRFFELCFSNEETTVQSALQVSNVLVQRLLLRITILAEVVNQLIG